MSNAPNLFDRLEGYAQENFVTETLAYLLQENAIVRDNFLDLLLAGKGKRLRAKFSKCEIDTQFSIDVGRPDLRISSRSDENKQVFVEVKVRSKDMDGQLEKYMERGYVAYLAPHPPASEVSGDWFLGHFYWFQVCEILKSTQRKSEIQRQFLTYLEARGMGKSSPITHKELKAAVHAVSVITKFQQIVTGVQKRIAPKWVKGFGPSGNANRVSVGVEYESLPNWQYRAKNWRKKGIGRFYLWIGIEVRDKTKLPEFFLGITTSQKKFAHTVESDGEELFAELRKLGWHKDPPVSDWCYAKFFPLGTGDIDNIAHQQAKNVMATVPQLKKVIKLMESKL